MAVTTLLLAAVLAAGQDATAAVVVRGALWVAVVVFLAALITQLGLLTWMELNRRDETMTASQSPTEPHGESRPPRPHLLQRRENHAVENCGRKLAGRVARSGRAVRI